MARLSSADSKDNRIRLNFLMVPQLVQKVDDYAKELGITRSYAFAVIVSNYFNYLDAQQITMESLAFMKSDDGKTAIKFAGDVGMSPVIKK